MCSLTDNDDSESDTVDNLATAEQPESEVLSQETVEKKKRHAKNVRAADTEDALIQRIRDTPCLYQKGLRDCRDTQKRTTLSIKKAAEMDMTGEFF